MTVNELIKALEQLKQEEPGAGEVLVVFVDGQVVQRLGFEPHFGSVWLTDLRAVGASENIYCAVATATTASQDAG
jgi:hypothetical protein